MKQVVAAIIVRDEQILICQRTRHQPMPLKWEFPGGKVEPDEQPADALRRELDEELGIDAHGSTSGCGATRVWQWHIGGAAFLSGPAIRG